MRTAFYYNAAIPTASRSPLPLTQHIVTYSKTPICVAFTDRCFLFYGHPAICFVFCLEKQKTVLQTGWDWRAPAGIRQKNGGVVPASKRVNRGCRFLQKIQLRANSCQKPSRGGSASKVIASPLTGCVKANDALNSATLPFSRLP